MRRVIPCCTNASAVADPVFSSVGGGLAFLPVETSRLIRN